MNSRHAKHWTAEEINLLYKYYEKYNITTIAKKLNRTSGAIRKKAFELGITYKDVADKISVRELFFTLGYGYNNNTGFYKSFINKGLPVTIRKISCKKRNHSFNHYYVNIDEFWKWLENNKSLVNLANFEKNSLGLEPTWVDEKRKIDLLISEKSFKCQKWSKEEDNLLISKALSGRYTIIDLSIDFKRSQGGIYNRLKSLDIKPSILKPVPEKKWSKEEEQIVIKLLKNNYNKNYIANTLYRTVKSLCSKIDKLKSRGCL